MKTTIRKRSKILFSKKAMQFIAIMIFVPILAQTAFADQGSQNETMFSESLEDTGVVIPRYFIGIDLSDRDQIHVYESIVFVKEGNSNYTGPLATWVPENAELLEISRREMSGSDDTVTPRHSHDGNLLIIDDLDRFNSAPMPPIYTIRYAIPTSRAGEHTFSKVLKDRPYPNYPIESLTIEIVPAQGTQPAITDGRGYDISAGAEETDDSFIYSWSSPQFDQINVGTENTDASPIKTFYFLAIIPLLIVVYVAFNRKNGPTKGKDDLEEMMIRHESILSVLEEMKDDMKDARISKEDYEHISKKYIKEADDLARKIHQLKNRKG